MIPPAAKREQKLAWSLIRRGRKRAFFLVPSSCQTLSFIRLSASLHVFPLKPKLVTVEQNVASVFAPALFFTTLTLNAGHKEKRLTKCSHADKLETPGHKKQRENGEEKKKKKQDMSTGKA